MTSLNSVKEQHGEHGEHGDCGVLIAGAGPTGLTLACELARRGVRVRLVERSDGLFPGSRGKGIQPRTLEVFDDLGIVDAVLRDGSPYPPMLRWKDGRPGDEFDLVQRGGPRPGAPYGEPWMLPQWRTQELLYERLRELGGEVEFGRELTGVTQDAQGVTAHFAAGGPEPSVRARYLVAADGGRSSVRSALGIPMNGETLSAEPTRIADVRVAGLDRERWHVWEQPEGAMLALCPLPSTDAFQLIAQRASADADIPGLVAARTHLAADQVKEVLYASQFRANAALADRFREGRVFLAGDAAHIHSPAGGQGLNTSVQDAYNLGWKLARVLHGGADAALLETYEAERAPLAAAMLGLSTRLHRGFWARREPETHQLDLAYRDSPLSPVASASPGGALRPGDRAPDAPCGAGRLFDVFRGPHFTLLALGGAAPPAELSAAPSERPQGGPEVRVHTLRAADGYASPALYLVRPDGYLAVVTTDPADVTGWLRDH
ncbi:FAD-dependent monooxygenase [Streptomyces boncukensis]|uniref:NAD-binding protein n=1 Tax=Streptomyces boncukensis TaxID=2711219 RepID=A0A6G4X4B1_9ACTN|nr:FAD-dependent monooxygenase [Streptomyces boncukensis]NGO72228.1 NAD-binding protein [Streptomyces boncukensis]